ncbi:MAG: hypothetical protein ACREOU_05140 [Candidatus Eiseniibacteriota bacterium]
MSCRTNWIRAGVALVLAGAPCLAHANTTPQALPFSQNWSAAGQITLNDDWTGVPGIQGYLGDEATSITGVNPCAVSLEFLVPTIDVIANQSNPNLTNGGVAEFDLIANPTIALQGSAAADNPHITLYLITTGLGSITVACNLRDIDGGNTDDAIQPVAVQFRVGNAGPWTNVATACTADATTGPNQATLVTPISAVLPGAAENQPEVQVRIMTSNAVGNDEWVGIDDISVTGSPLDCFSPHNDFGDAPECIPAYPSGVAGAFPTCLSALCPAGAMEIVCPPISTPPGAAAGFVQHATPAGIAPFWLGCYAPVISGIDDEPDGKVNTPAVGTSACHTGLPTDCVEAAFGLSFDQDECYTDGVDAGVTSTILLAACQINTFTYNVANCGPAPRTVFLNILVDLNEDGDWNDNVRCDGIPFCAYEWAVKNVPITLVEGCNSLVTPGIAVGPSADRGWLRLTISPDAVPDDFPWNGAVMQGGETEDYPVVIDRTTPTNPSSWGRVKSQYR